MLRAKLEALLPRLEWPEPRKLADTTASSASDRSHLRAWERSLAFVDEHSAKGMRRAERREQASPHEGGLM